MGTKGDRLKRDMVSNYIVVQQHKDEANAEFNCTLNQRPNAMQSWCHVMRVRRVLARRTYTLGLTSPRRGVMAD